MGQSTLMTGEYERLVTNCQPYLERQVEAVVGNAPEAAEAGTLEATESEPETGAPEAEAAGGA